MIKIIFEDKIIESSSEASVTIPGGNGGKVITVETETKYLWLQLIDIKEKAIIYIPDGKYEFVIPEGQATCGFEAGIFEKDFVFSARVAIEDDIFSYRNLAINPLDMQFDSEVTVFDAENYVNPIDSAAIKNGEVKGYPHIYGNRVTRHEGSFYARNVIDGISTQGGHGDYPYHSWGTSQYEDATIIIYFGRKIITDKVCLALRNDYALLPNGVEHDTYWVSATLEFSDGTEVKIYPVKTGDYQEFSFPEKEVEWVRLKELVPERWDNFASLNQIKVMGRDIRYLYNSKGNR